MSTQHPFEKAGLGKAPFKYIGPVMQDMAYGQAVLSREGGVLTTTAPGGSCAFCSAYIVHMFNVKSADGKVFHVGSDCIAKVYAEAPKEMSAIQKAVKAEIAKRNKARLADRAVEAKAFYATQEAQDWIKANLSYKGAEHLDFCMRKAGNARVVSEIKRLQKWMQESK